jgi:TolA-binding protein
VKGTRFEVAVVPSPSTCAPFVRTQVTVQEGVVAVRFGGGEVRLAAGSVWPACPPPASAVPSPRHHVHAPRAAGAPLPDTGAPAPTPADPSTLAEQNDLFAAALSARQRGDHAEAIHRLDRLIARYPNGQLTDSARAERRRLIEAGGEKAPSE